MDISYENLVKMAIEARKNSYAPYSNFKVGAALLTKDGDIIMGCNIENASFGATNCAERTAIFKAVSMGIKDFDAIAIVGGKEDEKDNFSDYAYPCGMCRQVMREFCAPDFKIIVGKNEKENKVYTLKELLPESFGPDNLK